jgi:hypothetical protein
VYRDQQTFLVFDGLSQTCHNRTSVADVACPSKLFLALIYKGIDRAGLQSPPHVDSDRNFCAGSRLRLAFLAKPLVKRFDGIGKIQRRILRALIFQEVQLGDEAEGRGIEIETHVYTGWPAQQDAAHEPLGPSQIVLPHPRIGFDVVIELLARRSAEADNFRRWRFGSQS